MKELLIISLFVVLINLACTQKQKFEPNLAVVNSEANLSDLQITANPTDALILIVSEKNEVFFGAEFLGKISETEELQQKFSQLLKQRKDKAVFVKVPRSVKYGKVTKVIELLKSSGAKPIGLQIEGLEKLEGSEK